MSYFTHYKNQIYHKIMYNNDCRWHILLSDKMFLTKNRKKLNRSSDTNVYVFWLKYFLLNFIEWICILIEIFFIEFYWMYMYFDWNIFYWIIILLIRSFMKNSKHYCTKCNCINNNIYRRLFYFFIEDFIYISQIKFNENGILII